MYVQSAPCPLAILRSTRRLIGRALLSPVSARFRRRPESTLGERQREVEPEHRALARLALGVKLAAVRAQQLPRDGEAEAAAAVAAGDARVRLRVRAEDLRQLRGVDADAGVGDAHADLRLGLGELGDVELEDDAARFGEFQR